ncbi:hypothetical protein KAH94_01715 [bacterium]|nr:hypothetical protein [bacterium]
MAVALSGCLEQPATEAKSVAWVYKTDADYHNQMSIILDGNGEVGLYPALPSSDEVKTENGFYYARGPKLPLNSLVVIDMTLDEFESLGGEYSANDFKDRILEMHPFEEAYFCSIQSLTDENMKELATSIGRGEIPTDCEEVRFSPRPGELE